MLLYICIYGAYIWILFQGLALQTKIKLFQNKKERKEKKNLRRHLDDINKEEAMRKINKQTNIHLIKPNNFFFYLFNLVKVVSSSTLRTEFLEKKWLLIDFLCLNRHWNMILPLPLEYIQHSKKYWCHYDHREYQPKSFAEAAFFSCL